MLTKIHKDYLEIKINDDNRLEMEALQSKTLL